MASSELINDDRAPLVPPPPLSTLPPVGPGGQGEGERGDGVWSNVPLTPGLPPQGMNPQDTLQAW